MTVDGPGEYEYVPACLGLMPTFLAIARRVLLKRPILRKSLTILPAGCVPGRVQQANP
jgi:hypothetical protein